MKRFEAFSSFLDSDGAENCLKNPENFCLKDGILIFFLSLLEIKFHSLNKFFWFNIIIIIFLSVNTF